MRTLAGGLRGYEKSASHRFFIKYGRLTLRTLRARVTGGKGREENLVPEGPDSRRKTSRLPLVLPLSVAKKEFALLFSKTVEGKRIRFPVGEQGRHPSPRPGGPPD